MLTFTSSVPELVPTLFRRLPAPEQKTRFFEPNMLFTSIPLNFPTLFSSLDVQKLKKIYKNFFAFAYDARWTKREPSSRSSVSRESADVRFLARVTQSLQARALIDLVPAMLPWHTRSFEWSRLTINLC